MKFKSSILALGAVAVMGGAVAVSDAKAGVLASSIFEVNNFFLVNSAGNIPSGITILSDVRNGEIAVGLNGVNSANTGNASNSNNLNLLPVLLGTNPFGVPNGDNSDTQFADGAGTFSRSDLFVSGTIFGTGGQGFTRSDAYALSGDNTGNANATIANNVLASYKINVDEDSQAQFVLDAEVYLKAFVSNDLFGTGSNSNASISFSVDVKDLEGNSILEWSPNQLNRGVTAFGVAGASNIGGFAMYDNLSSGLVDIAAGTYTVTIQQKSTAREVAVNQVPEPATIALFAIGLLGAGFAGRGSSRR